MGRFTVLEEIALADCALDVEGADLADLFETATCALAATMVDPATVGTNVERDLTLTAPSLDLLLYDWLSELIYMKDAEGLVFTKAVIRVHHDESARLHASVAGGRIEPGRTVLRADPKALTLHQFALEPKRMGGWHARLVIDI